MTPRISVIMGIYNCALTLPEAIDSLLNQTYKSFRIILCDDGSTDNTYEVAKQYADQYPFIRLIKNSENLKLAATLNHCLEYVDTEYVARMDGDDVSLPTRFEKEIDFLDKHAEFGFVSTPMIYFDKNGDWGVGKVIEMPEKKDFKYGSPFCHAPVMVRTSVYRAVGGYTTDKRVERLEDFYLWFKFYRAGYKGYNLSEPLYKMRDDKDAVKRRKLSDRLRTYSVGVEVKKAFDISYPYLSGLKNIAKGLLPMSLYRVLHKKRLER